MSKTILQIVHENTSTLDTTIPFLLVYKKEHPADRVIILYTRLNKRQVTRDGSFYSDYLESKGIEQYDLGKYFRGIFFPLRRLLLGYLSNSIYDYLPIRSILSSSLQDLVYVLPAIRIKAEWLIGRYAIRWKQILPDIRPDIVLWDLRGRLRFYGVNHFYSYFQAMKTDVILIPHAPHNLSATRDFFSHGELIYKGLKDSIILPNHYFWVAFKYASPEMEFPHSQKQFKKMGYPAFDPKWKKYLKKEMLHQQKTGLRSKCVMIPLRFFSARGQQKNIKLKFLYSYEETLMFLTKIGDVLYEKYGGVHIILKPHPKTNLLFIKELVSELRYHQWEISYNSFYALLPKVDYFISSFTTAVFLPIIYDTPIFLVESDTQNHVEQWDVLRTLYHELRCTTSLGKLGDAITNYEHNKDRYSAENEALLNAYWDTDSMDSCFKAFREISRNGD